MFRELTNHCRKKKVSKLLTANAVFNGTLTDAADACDFPDGQSTPMKKPGSANAFCRFCSAELRHTLVDLGVSPLCESYVRRDDLNAVEHFYPLRVQICQECLLAQLEEYVTPDEIFSEYAYFSSYSDSWVAHARTYVDEVIQRFHLRPDDLVVELASNDGYLLQHFVAKGYSVLGIEPAANVAAAAISKGVPTRVDFFGQRLARELVSAGQQPTIVIGNNVLAQVPDLNDFVAGVKRVLAPHGVVTMEFPHLLRLMEGNQFDTIYHEHFSYFSFLTVQKIFDRHGLALFDVQQLPTHGGSLRIFGQHAESAAHATTASVETLLSMEIAAGLDRMETYTAFEEQVRETKRQILEFLISAKRTEKSVAGYGAPGKGNTLLNYCGIRTDFLDYTVDRNPYKQGKYLPGTRIPIHHPDKIRETRPDYVLILPWNFKDEIMQQMAYIREWGGRFVVPIPRVEVC
jgi:SAM-dependent methyltransferase